VLSDNQESQLQDAERIISQHVTTPPSVVQENQAEVQALKEKLAEAELRAERYKTERNKLIKILKGGALKSKAKAQPGK
jgi:hypothetical protein